MYLLDTDTLIFLIRGHSNVAGNFDAHAAAPKALSVISYGELIYGAMKSAHPIENAAKARRLTQLFPIIDVSQPVIETFGSLKVELEKHGQKLEDFDLIIAATAIQLGYTVVTGNVRHFQRIPNLRVENWAK